MTGAAGARFPIESPPMSIDKTENELAGVPSRRMKHQATEIGGRRLHPSTMMMGHGYDPALSEGALKPPIFLTSTFVFESAAHGKRFFEGITGVRPGGAEGLVYSRFNGPDQEILEDRLALWEDVEDALVFSSGMSAIATVFLALLQPGDVVVHSAPLYAATETLIGRILGKFGITWLDFPAGATQAEIEEVMRAAKAKGRKGSVVSLVSLRRTLSFEGKSTRSSAAPAAELSRWAWRAGPRQSWPWRPWRQPWPRLARRQPRRHCSGAVLVFWHACGQWRRGGRGGWRFRRRTRRFGDSGNQ